MGSRRELQEGSRILPSLHDLAHFMVGTPSPLRIPTMFIIDEVKRAPKRNASHVAELPGQRRSSTRGKRCSSCCTYKSLDDFSQGRATCSNCLLQKRKKTMQANTSIQVKEKLCRRIEELNSENDQLRLLTAQLSEENRCQKAEIQQLRMLLHPCATTSAPVYAQESTKTVQDITGDKVKAEPVE